MAIKIMAHRDLLSPFGPTPPLYIERDSEDAILPSRGSDGAAGYDLSSVEPITDFGPGDRILVSTGLKMEIPKGYYGRIASRSGLTWKYGLNVGAGVIDSDYRGVVKILLFNHGKETLFFPSKTKIAQIIFEKIATPSVVEEKHLGETVRGDGGFGSTDRKGVTLFDSLIMRLSEQADKSEEQPASYHHEQKWMPEPDDESHLPPLMRKH